MEFSYNIPDDQLSTQPSKIVLPSHCQRIDLQSLKYKMNIVLKENARQYWDLLRKFMQAKLSKRELDLTASKILASPEFSNFFS